MSALYLVEMPELFLQVEVTLLELQSQNRPAANFVSIVVVTVVGEIYFNSSINYSR
jgi:hypothetical protein